MSELKETANATDSFSATVTRGAETWNYIYIMLGFALAVEGSAIQMVTPLIFPWNLITYVVVGLITVWLFVSSGWFHNKLIGLKIRYESKPR